MLTRDALGSITDHSVEVWKQVVANYIEKHSDNMISRQILDVRKVGTDAGIDVVTTYDARDSAYAKICAKGTVPSGSGVSVGTTKYEIYQILDGFDIHEKDLELDPKLKARNIDMCTRNIHRKEDDVVVNGETALNLDGIADIVPSGNKITTSTNAGAWSGTEANDIYQDVLVAIGMLDTDFEPSWILGHPTDINYLNGMDSERIPYWKTVIDLFKGAKTKDDFMKKSNRCTEGTVFIGCKDEKAGELVVSEELTVKALPMQRGRVYPVELYEWVTPEFHTADAYAQIATG
ncbi:MAG: hypothetical protein P9X24_04590 [Candidatus Hatepunaea meridiana]|nr:hypothetical protein [Candidatus Hatepunaea meridiana]